MEQIFYPDSLVVLGVSTRPEKMGKFIIANLPEFGYGGEIYAEVLEKTAVRVAPLPPEDACEMIAELKLDRLTSGFRGGPPLDRESLSDAILKLSQLLITQPQVAELDINPLLLLEEGILALDARILLRRETVG
ncbi:MAG: acetate--CoA ligase family protein [Candidatus Bipolaricaulia bacterium]